MALLQVHSGSLPLWIGSSHPAEVLLAPQSAHTALTALEASSHLSIRPGAQTEHDPGLTWIRHAARCVRVRVGISQARAFEEHMHGGFNEGELQ